VTIVITVGQVVTAPLDSSAVQSARRCINKSAMNNGKPVAVWVTYQIEFLLPR